MARGICQRMTIDYVCENSNKSDTAKRISLKHGRKRIGQNIDVYSLLKI